MIFTTISCCYNLPRTNGQLDRLQGLLGPDMLNSVISPTKPYDIGNLCLNMKAAPLATKRPVQLDMVRVAVEEVSVDLLVMLFRSARE